MSNQQNYTELLELTTEIVSAHVGNNALSVGDLPQLIKDVYRTLSNVGSAQGSAMPEHCLCRRPASHGHCRTVWDCIKNA